MSTELYKIIKLPSDTIMENKRNIPELTVKNAMMDSQIVSLADNQVLHKIRDYYETIKIDLSSTSTSDESLLSIVDDIVNIVIPMDKGKEDDYENIATSGFTLNGKDYDRLCSGSGQIRRNTITFIRKELYSYIFKALCCGLSPEDFGDDFNTAKFNAYFGLNMSGVHFLKQAPRVCVVDDYEEVLPHLQVDYITTNITEQCSGNKTKKIIKKEINPLYYDEILNDEGKPTPLNSFDGQGLCDPTYAKKIALELGYLKEDGTGYTPSEYIIRAPWIKGLVVNFNWKEYCRNKGVEYLTDIFTEDKKSIDDIDFLISKSQFKMHKQYKEKGGWDYYTKSMKENNLLWGVVMPNKENDDHFKTLNYQYLNALSLTNKDIDDLCKRTENILTRLCEGDMKQAYQMIISHDSKEDESCSDDEIDANDSTSTYKTFLQKAVEYNSDLLQDEYIQELIFKQSKAKFKDAKIGKIECPSNFQFIISDPVAQIQFVIRNHAASDDIVKQQEFKSLKVQGLLKENEVYSHYWNENKYGQKEKIILMRSPMIDKSEIAVRNLVNTGDTRYWYGTVKSGIILSIHDLTTLQMQNCDMDGDRCFSSNLDTLVNGAMENPRPLLYPSNKKESITGCIANENLIAADIRGLNSKVGTISNEGAILYALLANYSEGSWEYNEVSRRIEILGELVGVEIDRIKTSIPPKRPSDWAYEQIITKGTDNKIADSSEEIERKRKHNALATSKKPYYFRYIYDYLDKDINSINTGLKHEALWNYGIKLDKLLRSPTKELTEEQLNTVYKYQNFYPVIDSNCNVNRICHKFEKLEHKLQRSKMSRKMLFEYCNINTQIFDGDILQAITGLYNQYKKQLKFITAENNSGEQSDSDKSKRKNTKERFNSLFECLKRQILFLCKEDIKTALRYMLKVIKDENDKENFIWDVLGEQLLCDKVIPPKNLKLKNQEE